MMVFITCGGREVRIAVHRLIKRFLVYSVIAASSLLAALSANADVRVKKTNDQITVYISGTITEGDAKEFQEIASNFEFLKLYVDLDSNGGSVAAATQIGRIIRKYDGWVLIDGKCYSSCALIFIAGVMRLNWGELGLHRPYLAAAPQSRDTIERQLPLMLAAVKNYVAEMGVSDNFYQQMVNTEPSQIVIYNHSDYQKLVPASDPIHAEIQISRQARKYGLTTAEMRQREQNAKSRCDILTDGSRRETCREAIKWGLSEPVFIARKAKVNCPFSFEEAVEKIPLKLRQDDIVTIRLETCTRNIMLER